MCDSTTAWSQSETSPPTRRCPGRRGALAVAACSSSDDAGVAETGDAATADTTTTAAPATPVVFSGQGNDLVAYADRRLGRLQRVFTNQEDDPETGRDINAQICFFPTTRTASSPARTPASRTRCRARDLRARGRHGGRPHGDPGGQAHPDLPGSADNAENRLRLPADGRIVTSDVGNQANGDGDGQLIRWFPPFTGGEYVDGGDNAGFDDVAFCKVDVGIATAGGLYVDGEDVYVGSARPPTAGVLRYSGDWPTGPDADGGCGRTDGTGAPLVDEGR